MATNRSPIGLTSALFRDEVCLQYLQVTCEMNIDSLCKFYFLECRSQFSCHVIMGMVGRIKYACMILRPGANLASQ